MGLPILILGFSGSGKSSSMRNFESEELALINVNGKPLPFRGRFKNTLQSDDYGEITQYMKNCGQKTIVIDDTQYLMANEFMRRAKETGFQKFTDIGQNFWNLIKTVDELPGDVTVYFLHHMAADDDGRQKIKTIGKMLDEKITIEGMFSIVLKTAVKDGKYFFITQSNGADTCKSPMGMFSTTSIDNDLKIVEEAVRLYYEMSPEQVCCDCGKPITTDGKRTVEQIVEGSVKYYGKKLCMKCVKRHANEAKTVSK